MDSVQNKYTEISKIPTEITKYANKLHKFGKISAHDNVHLVAQFSSRNVQTYNVTAHNEEHTGYSLLDLCLCS